MVKAKRKHKLMIQTALIILPTFIFMIAAVVWVIYTSSVDSYLKAQDKQIDDIINAIITNTIPCPTDTKEFLWDLYVEQLIQMQENVPLILDDEEEDMLKEYWMKDNHLERSWYEDMSSDLSSIWIRDSLSPAKDYIDESTIRDSLGCMFVISADNKHQARSLFDMDSKQEEDRTGGFYNLDISKMPALQKAFETADDSMIYEKVEDFPTAGNYYLGYRPVVVKGKTIAVIGLAYNWDDLHSSVVKTVINAIVIVIIGMILLMIVLLVFLYRKAIKPISIIRKGLQEYADDKDSAQIVNKMLSINTKNELVYLSDTISDLALEIDHYTKENVRIAVECERAETERERAEKEAYEAKVAVMASQIRPHFMYNALTSIAMMCQIDPEIAQEATITFAKYLRGNMDSLKQTKPVPFEVELEHLKKYLYIEKLRFGEKLNVEYDITAIDFKVPMLTVQPIVENAVKHGVGMKKKGGTVTISTRETEDAFIVAVSDDGVGFDMNAPKKEDGRTHVGMENTRTRLREMCGAEINIESTVDVGTTATIILPKERQN